MRRRALLLPVVLAIALLACGGCTPTSAGAREGAAGTTTRTSGADGTTVVFYGDSYTAASEDGGGYALRVAEAMGWTPVLVAVGGTGYVAAGSPPEAGAYEVRLDQVVAADPDVVVLQGSTNDVGSPVDEVQAAALDLYRQLQARLPDAELVVVGPLAPSGVDRAGVLAVRDVLAAAADEAGIRFIDPIADGWLSPADGLFADAIHPNDAGYRQFADELVAALRAEGP